MRKTTTGSVRAARGKKRTAPLRKGKLTVDASRLALAAMERIRSVLSRKGHADRFGPPVTMRELAARASYLGVALPPSYSAAMRVAAKIGEPERLLTAQEMRGGVESSISPRASRPDGERLAPFAKIGERHYACFDRSLQADDGELAVVEWREGVVRPWARHFGEWLDAVADAREEALEAAADIPENLRDLLVGLGFNFDDPIVGRMETGDTEAIEALLGPERTKEVRGDVGRLFDSSGRAALTLNVDEFTLAVALRTGLYVFEPEDVFRWLRWFRDEGFFGEPAREPSHPERVRDLRRAPREPPLVLRGVLEVACAPARRHHFRSAAGRSVDDFYLLGRTGSTSDRSPSLLLHVVEGHVRGAHSLDEPLTHLHVTSDGTVWGLSHGGTALRFNEGVARAYPLNRPGRGTGRWFGIGGSGSRVLVWGAGALLEFDGERFAPITPQPELEEHETVVALAPLGNKQIHMLVCGDGMGAVARFDGRKWLPIAENHVIEGQLVDMDVWRSIGIVLARSGEVWRVDEGPPRPVIWDTRQAAFISETGAPRTTYAVRGFDGGALLASDGGVIAVGAGDPVFHAAGGVHEPARLARVGGSGGGKVDADRRPAVIALCGQNAWIWQYAGGVGSQARAEADQRDAFWVIDARDW
ncbi:MAG TPA: hypothetical protein VMI75_23970 [Polyangiaceae bacterium]|nr:hypothetical protein [Polyangiaceae bacterium]